jgi:hypothetical protein
MTETNFSFLKVDGEKIVDENGNNVILKGAGLGGWMKYVSSLSPAYKPFLCTVVHDQSPVHTSPHP